MIKRCILSLHTYDDPYIKSEKNLRISCILTNSIKLLLSTLNLAWCDKKENWLNGLNLGLFFSFTMSIQINQRPFNNSVDQSSLEKQSNRHLSINSLIFSQNDRESSFYVRHNKRRAVSPKTHPELKQISAEKHNNNAEPLTSSLIFATFPCLSIIVVLHSFFLYMAKASCNRMRNGG